MPAFPRSAFWDFSLRLYGRPGIAEACLRLQARHGIDVNLLFCCLWRGTEGQRLSRREIAAMMAHVKTLHEQVVRPLRTARIALKPMLDGDPARAPALAAIRAAVKKCELDAEHAEQLALAAMFEAQPSIAGTEAPDAAALANAESYFAAAGPLPDAADEADLGLLAAGAVAAKSEPSHAVESPPRKARERGNSRPLASGGGGA